MSEFDFAQYRQALSNNIADLCPGPVAGEPLLNELQRVADEAERLLEQHQVADRSLLDCGPGCSSCCVVNVSTLLLEGIAIAHYLRGQDVGLKNQIRSKVEDLWREVRGLDDEERLCMRRKCAFLDEQGCCSIYPVRPLLCRSLSSTDADRCREALVGQVFGEERPILMHQFQQQLYETLFVGVADGLEKGGLDGRSFQLTGLIRFLFKHPEAAAELLEGRRLCWQDLY
ncbi:MAG: YkgJ family cysteine cluster protein [Desulfuromonadales bacterium]|nr:YkgJ family cysteine cluster protein [Desulfuromonadales bacterium]